MSDKAFAKVRDPCALALWYAVPLASLAFMSRSASSPDTLAAEAGPAAERARKRAGRSKTARPSAADGRRLVGWREWVALPALGVELIQAKIDTGAWSVALHADHIRIFERDGRPWVRFTLPEPGVRHRPAICCEAPVHDLRAVKSSSGRSERRTIIVTDLVVGEDRWPVEVSLTNRNEMGFRMLLGRAALRRRRFLINPRRSFLQGKPLGGSASGTGQGETP